LVGACGKKAPPAAAPPAATPPAAAPLVAPANAGARPLPTRAQPKLRTLKLWLGTEEITAELAVMPDEIYTGMMFRTNLAANAGMLFFLGQPTQPSFWMKNCPLALSAAFIDPAGIILELHDFQPQDTNPVVATALNVQYVLETSRGWFEQHHIGNGTLVRTEHGTFPETFIIRRAPVR